MTKEMHGVDGGMEMNKSQWKSIELDRIWYDDKLHVINKAHDEWHGVSLYT